MPGSKTMPRTLQPTDVAELLSFSMKKYLYGWRCFHTNISSSSFSAVGLVRLDTRYLSRDQSCSNPIWCFSFVISEVGYLRFTILWCTWWIFKRFIIYKQMQTRAKPTQNWIEPSSKPLTEILIPAYSCKVLCTNNCSL